MGQSFAVPNSPKIRLGIALPGGGVLGAFTAGVVNALSHHTAFCQSLANSHITIDVISGTSAGAVQGSILAGHLNAGQTAGFHAGQSMKNAARGLAHLWDRIESSGRLAHCFSRATMTCGTYPNLSLFEQMAFQSSVAMLPSGTVPGWIARTVQDLVPDWHDLAHGLTELQVNAVRVQARKAPEHVIFRRASLTPGAIAASTALERFGGYKIGQDVYYDGGYAANPYLDPQDLADRGITDVIAMPLCAPPPHILADTSLCTHFRPHSARTKPKMEDIYQRLAQLREDQPGIRQHIIALTPERHWNESAAMNNDGHFIQDLMTAGANAAAHWLQNDFASLVAAPAAAPELAELANIRYHEPHVELVPKAA
ncbi:MAG: patatin-like phospholipase family protein [Pseudomonadota bacterium]